MTSPRPKLSAAIITLNEADRLPRLLASLAFADEIIVVDSGSTDGTQELADRHGAKVIEHQFMGFVAQKQLALDQTSGDWILSLDADEVVSPELATEIEAVLSEAPSDIAGLAIPRLSRYLGRWIRHGGWYPDRQVRLVRRGLGRWAGGRLHERLIVSGRVANLTNPILHYVYRNVADQVVTINKFSDLFAAEHQPRRLWYLIVGLGHVLVKFFECYIWKLGFLDGAAGLVIAMNSAFYIFLKHAKLWEKSLTSPGA